MYILDNFNIGKMSNTQAQPVHVLYADICDAGQQAVFLFASFNYKVTSWKEYNQNETPVM